MEYSILDVDRSVLRGMSILVIDSFLTDHTVLLVPLQ